jgi:predicted amidohydrolase YtcJ
MKVKMQNKWALIFGSFVFMSVMVLFSCKSIDSTNKSSADLVLHHAFVYPVSGSPIEDGAVVIKDGKIQAIGATDEIMREWSEKADEIKDCHGAFLMPGFIEGHGHFSGLGFNLIRLDLMDSKSWQEIVDSVALRVKRAKPGEWIQGRGWHQEKWTTPLDKNINGYPYHDLLSKVSPDNPVLLSHASGHSLFANEAAMKAAGVTRETSDPPGGHIVRDASGVALGVFEERAMALIRQAHDEYLAGLPEEAKLAEWHTAIQKAQKHCLGFGITSFQDAGSSFAEITRYDNLARHDSLDLRLWVMLRHPYEELKGHMDGFPILRSGTDMFTCRAIKSEVDGALGSFGAWLLEPYNDKPGFTGQNTTSIYDIKGIADLAIENGMQMCVHAIGDRANRVVLDIYEGVISAHPDSNGLRWRIEHAQHLNPTDIPRFKQLGIIASMQGIHCTSDAPFVVKRLGEERARFGAYAWRSLLDQGVIIANGTDAPVERIDPVSNFYASVTRKRLDNGQVFFNEQAMTREEAIYSYTLGNAYAAFEEDIKGSLEPGKWADIVLLSENLLNCPEDRIPVTKVLWTMVGGEVKYDGSSEQ